MQYIKKNIEIDTSGHINECWMVDFKTVSLLDLPNITVTMIGYKSYTDMLAGKRSSDSRVVHTNAVDLQLNGGISYSNIPRLYELLTTQEVNGEVTYIDGEPTYEQIPKYVDFFGGQIIEV